MEPAVAHTFAPLEERPLTIALIGDHRSAVCRLRLELDGYDVSLYPPGEALDALASGSVPDLLFVDVRTFEGGLADELERIQERSTALHVPLLVIPGSDARPCALHLVESADTGSCGAWYDGSARGQAWGQTSD